MAIPQPVLDILNKLEIAGLPTVISPGEILRPQLNPGVEALSALGLGQILGTLDLDLTNVVLDIPKLVFGESVFDLTLDSTLKDETEKLPGTTDVKVVLEAAEFARPVAPKAGDVNIERAATGPLTYLRFEQSDLSAGYLPKLGTSVQGLVGKLAGQIKQVEKLTGTVKGTLAPVEHLVAKLTGKITGKIKGAELLKLAPKVTVKWHVEGNHVLLDNTTLDNPLVPPVFVVLPEFGELTRAALPTSQLRISCDVTIDVTLTDNTEESRTHRVGPVNIEVPRIPIPTLAAFVEHGATDTDQFPGRVLMAVPAASALDGLTNLRGFLEPAESVLRKLQQTLTVVNAALSTQFGEAADVLGKLIEILGQVNQPLIRQDAVHYLSSVTLDPGGWFGVGYRSWEDEISSILFIGPPGAALSCHNRRNLWQGTGQFKLIIGPAAAAWVLDLNKPVVRDDAGNWTQLPDCIPPGTVFEVVVPPDNSRRVFNDVISSFQFLPVA